MWGCAFRIIICLYSIGGYWLDIRCIYKLRPGSAAGSPTALHISLTPTGTWLITGYIPGTVATDAAAHGRRMLFCTKALTVRQCKGDASCMQYRTGAKWNCSPCATVCAQLAWRTLVPTQSCTTSIMWLVQLA